MPDEFNYAAAGEILGNFGVAWRNLQYPVLIVVLKRTVYSSERDVTTLRMPSTTSRNAESRSLHIVTGNRPLAD
jgi:hypothetical protein